MLSAWIKSEVFCNHLDKLNDLFQDRVDRKPHTTFTTRQNLLEFG